ncbi:MAG: UDP-N-acetylmuramate dehydrogenase [Planctomycetes bacterium]|nr:UDP-N-acetylmuramate dehydrogenase [Planctomycetota bacterium]
MMALPGYIRENVTLAPFTSFGIGGPARWLAEPATRDDVRDAFALAREWGVRIYILGGGSNLLVADDGVDGMVVRLAASGLFGRVEAREDGLSWSIGSAAPLAAFVRETVGAGVRGLESLAGIPGTVGGAVTMNSGAAGGGIGRFVTGADIVRFDGTAEFLGRDGLAFDYRTSAISEMLALRFDFAFTDRDDPFVLRDSVRRHRERKRASQPLTIPSAGCVFKNPPGDSAGSLLDEAGGKGRRDNDAVVSRVHANFVVNQANATAMDVFRLVVRMRELVWRRTGIVLEPEIRLWGFTDDLREFHA